jgi:hypothetical protein
MSKFPNMLKPLDLGFTTLRNRSHAPHSLASTFVLQSGRPRTALSLVAKVRCVQHRPSDPALFCAGF